MQATIKKVKDGRWFVDIEGYNVTAVFDEHDEAVISAYNEGCDNFNIKYSNNISRSFNREGIEHFVLKVA